MFTAILIALASLAFIGLVTVTILTYNFIVNWFRNRANLKNADKANIAFTLQEKLNNKQYKTVQGIFNKRTNEVVDAQEIRSNQVDSQVAQNHASNQLVIYE